MKLEISSRVVDAIMAATATSANEEVCGLQFGTAERIEHVQLCRNVADRPRSEFEIDPQALIAAHKAMRQGGPQVVGCFHSHPSGDAEPSSRDATTAAPDGSLWLICARGRMGVWRSVVHGARHGRFDAVAWRRGEPCAPGAASPEEQADFSRSLFVR